MEARHIHPLVLRELNLRIGEAMAEYVARQVANAEEDRPIPIIGGDARTGVPMRKLLDPRILRGPATAP